MDPESSSPLSTKYQVGFARFANVNENVIHT
jgi:hypothetical protein